MEWTETPATSTSTRYDSHCLPLFSFFSNFNFCVQVIGGYVFFIVMYYLILARKSLELLDCFQQPDGTYTLGEKHYIALESLFCNLKLYFNFRNRFHTHSLTTHTRNTQHTHNTPHSTHTSANMLTDALPSMTCYSEEWFSILPYSLGGICAYVIGIPLFFHLKLYFNKERFDTQVMTLRYGALYT